VLIRARMRAGAAWSDACILNMSPRGLGLQAPTAPPKGSYVKLRRGAHVLVGRVIWSKYHRFGVRTQDRVPLERLIKEPENASADMASARAASEFTERRAARRPASARHDDSRMVGRMLQFGSVVVLGACAALIASGGVGSALAEPLSRISTALDVDGRRTQSLPKRPSYPSMSLRAR
jgi:hypothetical protein